MQIVDEMSPRGRKHFPPGQMIQCELSTPNGAVPHQAPRYLYRGECGLFPTTESSRVRIEPSLNGRELEALSKVTDAMRRVLKQDGYDNSEWEAEGLLEHYGVPSGIVNFTASPRLQPPSLHQGTPTKAESAF